MRNTLLGAALTILAALAPQGAHADCGRKNFYTPHLEGQPWERSAFVIPHGSDAPRTRAVLIGSMIRDTKSNFSPTWNTVSLAYVLLQRIGVPKSQIRIVFGNTEDESLKIWNLSEKKIAPEVPHDFDCDGTPDIVGHSTRTGVTKAINDTIDELRPGERLLILFADHGYASGLVLSPNTNDPSPYELFSPKELSKLLDRVPSTNPVALLVDACYSGVFQELGRTLGGRNRCIVTAASANEVGYTGGEYHSFMRGVLDVMGHSPEVAGANTGNANHLQQAYAHGLKTANPKQHPQVSQSQLSASKNNVERLLNSLVKNDPEAQREAELPLYEATDNPLDDGGLRLRRKGLLPRMLRLWVESNPIVCERSFRF